MYPHAVVIVKDPTQKPDFRSTVYWNPSIRTDSQGKADVLFFCTDDIGTMRIRIDGITSDGKPFTTEQTIEVVLKD